MNCRRARHLLFDFFDGMSNEALRAELDRHLGECSECERFAGEMTRALSLLHKVPVEPLDETFNWKVRLAIHRERNSVRSGSHSATAWARAWNLRYVASTGLAFAAVLVVGAVLLGRGDGSVPPPGGANPSEPTAATTSPNPASGTQLVPRSAAPWRNDAGQMVSLGGGSPTRGTTPAGAIDQSEAEARIDSLIAEELMRMSPWEQAKYIERRIIRLQSHLQSQQTTPARP